MSKNLREIGKNIKLIITDLDGTLLNNDKRISPTNLDTIKQAQQQGIKFGIATGRIPCMSKYYFHITETGIPAITTNGAIVWDTVNNKSLAGQPMDQEEMLEVVEICRFHQTDYSLLTEEEGYFSVNSQRLLRFLQYNELAQEAGLEPMPLFSLDEYDQVDFSKEVFKILITEKDDRKYKKILADLSNLKNSESTISERSSIDVSYRGIDKGHGLKILADFLQLKKEEICVFGDYDNDISMLKLAGLPIAMANAQSELKEHAAFVTENNIDDGVAKAIQEFILN